ncbi:MAG TPA: phosphonopyruvate decarboxylase [Candidatus Stackebrandtia faecavium]|nr:phosphonopyruvate decarboxylase [Candidatus Stackebrandtia faecavium]
MSIDPKKFCDHLGSLGVSLYTGVPDSLLKQLGSHIMANLPREQHVITANEGAAVGMAIGHYMSTKTPAVVYMQNSGFGNVVNPLLSLADSDVYGIPMLVVVGWRGQPGVKDEPQHVKQGKVQRELVEALEVPWSVLPHDQDEADKLVSELMAEAVERKTPAVLLVEKGTFSDAEKLPKEESALPSREDALVSLTKAVGDDAAIVSTTGMLSRELFEYRANNDLNGDRDFLTVGGMGHASAIALGVAKQQPEREVWCFDGDGALLMHMGGLAVIADHAPSTFFHVVFNNGVHDSVGGQPTSIGKVDVPAVAKAMGYTYATATEDLDSIAGAVAQLREHGGPALLELKVKPGNRSDIGRPTRTPAESKNAFMGAL